MPKKKQEKDSHIYDGRKLWDEILKAIVYTMPEQLFPLFKEVYGKEYPKGTDIRFLDKETTTFWEGGKKPPGSTFMDMDLLIAGTDYYHVECQMKNDKDMVIRLFAYDVNYAITHTKTVNKDTGEITLEFPRSVVIYPEKNRAVPDYLKCRILFQDNSEHIYKIPTVKVQTYSLEEIRKKHLTMFLPYTMLRFRPRLRRGKMITEKELTEHLEEVILILEEEVTAGNLTDRQYQDYVRLIYYAADRVFAKYRNLRKEVYKMTKPLIKLPSMEIKEMEEKLEKLEKLEKKYKAKEAKLMAREAKYRVREEKLVKKYETRLAKQERKIAKYDALDAENQRLKAIISQISNGEDITS